MTPLAEAESWRTSTIRSIALNRKNALFAGHDARAENWAVIASLVKPAN